jgi:hypothetical protein
VFDSVKGLDGLVDMGLRTFSMLQLKLPFFYPNFLNLTSTILPEMLHSISINPRIDLQLRSF